MTQPVKSTASLRQKSHTIKTHLNHSRKSDNKDNTAQKGYNILKHQKNAQLPNPLINSNYITLPAEVNCHGNVELTDATVRSQKKQGALNM